MAKKIFLYKRTAKLPKKILDEIAAEGYICLPVRYMDDIKVVENFEVEDGWLLENCLDLIENDAISSNRERLGKRIIKRVRETNKEKLDSDKETGG